MRYGIIEKAHLPRAGEQKLTVVVELSSLNYNIFEKNRKNTYVTKGYNGLQRGLGFLPEPPGLPLMARLGLRPFLVMNKKLFCTAA